MAKVVLENVWKKYGKVEAVRGISLECRDGEFFAILGPSGCGKTSTLRMIAGLERVTSGEIYIGNRRVTHLRPKERNIAMAFETYALYPPLTAYENIAFPLRVKGVPAKEIDRQVKEIAELLEITHTLDKKPVRLSDGERQRIGLARALVRKPEVFLLDEPLSHLDAQQRRRLRINLKRLHHTLGITMILVTHDQAEAMALADRVAIMDSGIVHQVGTVEEIYNSPRDRFVADFIGEPPMNFLPCRFVYKDSRGWLVTNGVELPAPERLLRFAEKNPVPEGLVLGVRPAQVEVSLSGGEEWLKAGVFFVEPLGDYNVLTLELDGTKLQAVTRPGFLPRVGDTVFVRLPRERVHLFKPTGEAI